MKRNARYDRIGNERNDGFKVLRNKKQNVKLQEKKLY